MKNIKYIVWDWNGTLLDDIAVSMEALNVILKKATLPPVNDMEEYRRYFQFPVIEYYQKIGFDFEKTPFAKLAEEYMKYYQPHSFQCELHAYAKETLASMASLGKTQFILSASNLTFLKEQVALYDIEQYFDGIAGLDNIHAHSKAELAKSFVKELQAQPGEVVFIGDSVHDSEVAKGAGAHCILIANGHEHKEKLLRTGNKVVDNMQACKRYLLTL